MDLPPNAHALLTVVTDRGALDTRVNSGRLDGQIRFEIHDAWTHEINPQQ